MDLELGNKFSLDTKCTINKSKIDKLDLTQVKNICSGKDPVEKKTQAIHGKKIFANHVSDKELVYVKNFQNLQV